MSRFRFDCERCDVTVRATSEDELKARGRDHLESDHYDELTEQFSRAFAGEACENDCGYVFPATIEEVAEYDCPDCGYDNFPAFVRRYLYWRIEDTG